MKTTRNALGIAALFLFLWSAPSLAGRTYVAGRIGFHEPDTYLMETTGGPVLEGPVDASWVHIPYGKAEFNSPVDAESYTYSQTPGDMICYLLRGDKYQVAWNIVCADLPDHFDNATWIEFGGERRYYTDVVRNPEAWKFRGAELWVNVTAIAGVTGLILDTPGPGLYKIAGIER